MPIKIPCTVSGRISADAAGAKDRRGSVPHGNARRASWIIETDAAGRGSPLDTRIEVLHADGKTVERVKLQAVRDSFINFRTKSIPTKTTCV